MITLMLVSIMGTAGAVIAVATLVGVAIEQRVVLRSKDDRPDRPESQA